MSDTKYDPEVHELPKHEVVRLLLWYLEFGQLFVENYDLTKPFLDTLHAHEITFRQELYHKYGAGYERNDMAEEKDEFDLEGHKERYRHYWELYNFSDRDTDLIMLTPLFMEIINQAKEK